MVVVVGLVVVVIGVVVVILLVLVFAMVVLVVFWTRKEPQHPILTSSPLPTLQIPPASIQRHKFFLILTASLTPANTTTTIHTAYT